MKRVLRIGAWAICRPYLFGDDCPWIVKRKRDALGWAPPKYIAPVTVSYTLPAPRRRKRTR